MCRDQCDPNAPAELCLPYALQSPVEWKRDVAIQLQGVTAGLCSACCRDPMQHDYVYGCANFALHDLQ